MPPLSPEVLLKAHKVKRRRKRLKVFLFLTSIPLVIGGIAAAVGANYIIKTWEATPNINRLKPQPAGSNSIVYAANGQPLGYIGSSTLRTPVPFSALPQRLIEATVAVEDKRFYQTNGVDWQGILRAAAADALRRSVVQGGSTLAMQLVRNLYYFRSRSLALKIAEARLAEQLEAEHSKSWILQQYLNNVPYGTFQGQDLIGVQSASRTYFGKNVSHLTLVQAALLAGLPQAPSEYNPLLYPQAALVRRNEVLEAMGEAGYLTTLQVISLQKAPLELHPTNFYGKRQQNYFFNFVNQELESYYGASTLEEGGLQIKTTLDPALQQEAQKAISSELSQPGDPAAVLVALDPHTGAIKAMASSTNYGQSNFNLATQGLRQPGSTFKAIVLATALTQGINPDTTYYDSHPLNFNLPEWGNFTVHNFDNDYVGVINVHQGLLLSDNAVFAQLTLDVGPQNVENMAHRMGVTTSLEANPAIGLGGLTYGVSPLDMASVYATIDNNGVHITPTGIQSITVNGQKQRLPQTKTHVLSSGVVTSETRLLIDNVQEGTGTGAQFGCPVAGKTGTTTNFKDAWFIGYTPNLVTAVWMGYPKGGQAMTDVNGIAVTGGSIPAAIWKAFMEQANGPCQSFTGTPASNLHAFCGEYTANCGGYGGQYAIPSLDAPTSPIKP